MTPKRNTKKGGESRITTLSRLATTMAKEGRHCTFFTTTKYCCEDEAKVFLGGRLGLFIPGVLGMAGYISLLFDRAIYLLDILGQIRYLCEI
jgi:hypothetical protein